MFNVNNNYPIFITYSHGKTQHYHLISETEVVIITFNISCRHIPYAPDMLQRPTTQVEAVIHAPTVKATLGYDRGNLMNRKLRPFLVCLFVLALTTNAIAEVDLTRIVKKTQPSIVTVITYDNKGKVKGQGSGFFINRKGHLITNYHVLRGADTADIKTYDGKIYPVNSVLAENENMDLIKLSVGIREAPPNWLSVTPTLPAIAERIVVIGSPLGLEQTVSEGIVSGIREIPKKGKVLQMSAPISPGSSGSPVVNMNGDVVGVATFYLVKGQNLNFAIPAQYLLDLKPSKTVKTIAEWTSGVDQKPLGIRPKRCRLFVQTEPEGARVRILNIKPKFNQGIILKPGRYLVEVSADGYETERVWIKVEQGDDKTLRLSLKKLPQLLTKDPDEMVKIGNAYTGKGEYKRAIEAYKQAIRINSDHADAHGGLGYVYYRLGRYEEAIEAYKNAVRIEPDYFFHFHGLAISYGGLNLDKEALGVWKQVVLFDPDSPLAHLGVGEYSAKLGLHREAIGAYKQALRIKSDYAMAYRGLGNVYSKLGNNKEAIEAFKQAIRIDPDYAKAHRYLGTAYGELGRYKEAADAFKQAIRIDPDDASVHYDLGVSYNKLERHREAIEAYKQAIRIYPDYAAAYLNQGVSCGILDRYREAVEAFKQVIRIDPDDAKAHRHLGIAYLNLGDKGSALEQYKILKTLDKELANELFNSIYE